MLGTGVHRGGRIPSIQTEVGFEEPLRPERWRWVATVAVKSPKSVRSNPDQKLRVQ